MEKQLIISESELETLEEEIKLNLLRLKGIIRRGYVKAMSESDTASQKLQQAKTAGFEIYKPDKAVMLDE